MFLINSSVGSFAAAPTSLDVRYSRSKEHYSCYFVSENYRLTKKDLSTLLIVINITSSNAYSVSVVFKATDLILTC